MCYTTVFSLLNHAPDAQVPLMSINSALSLGSGLQIGNFISKHLAKHPKKQ